MTVRVTTLKGTEAGMYYTERLPSYYLDGDEPPGVWWGNAADRLGLSGVVDSEAFLAVMAGRHPVSRADLGRTYGEGAVRGYDATFSAPKSVSVLFALGDDQIRDGVVEAHERAVGAVLAWVQDRAHTRMRRHGHVMCVDAEGIVVGVFRQHTSRRLDPQLHTHAVIANRVPSDGRWLALDARTIKMDQRTLSALYHAGLRAELTRRLGVRWREPEHGIAEIADIPDMVLAEFSQRSGDIDQRMGTKLARFRTDLGRDPTPEEQWRLEREAVVDSRPAKRHDMTHHQLHAEWHGRVRRLGLDPHGLVSWAVGHHRAISQVDQRVVAGMAAQAVDALETGQSSWRPAEVLREVAAVFPATVPADADRLVGWLQALSEHMVERRCVDLRPPTTSVAPVRRDGRPITEAVVDRRLTTHTILREEKLLLSWADNRLSLPGTVGHVDGRGLDPGQVEVAARLAGDRGLELVQGPAGAGKTTALATGVASLCGQGRSVFGVAPTAAGAEVLATETAMAADTLDKLLTEHTLNRPPLQEFDLPWGTTIIVDEAGTASTPALARLAELADQKHWRVVLVGDPRQFSAVGRGGLFAHLVDRHGAVGLDQVHRFRHDWERHASLQLRTGHPQAIEEYERHGRLHAGTSPEMEEQVIEAWRAARARGETVAVMANSNDAVNRLNRRAQQTRFLHGEITFQKGHLRLGTEMIGVGDQVVTRRNDRSLRTDQGTTVKNRAHWTVQTIHPDHSVTLTGATGSVTLPADYATRNLELGYAQTSHATQGRTVDTALVLVDTPTDHAGIYTPMTRGRESNHAYVVVEDNQTAADVLTQATHRRWIDQPAITHPDPAVEQQLPRQLSKAEELEYVMRHAHRAIQRREAISRDSRGLTP